MGRFGLVEISILFFVAFLVIRFLIRSLSKKSDDVNVDSVDFEKLISTNYKKVKKYTQKNISKSYMTGCTWILVDKNVESILYTFRENGELLITKDGIVEKSKYELIIDNNSILIERNEVIGHYNIINVHDDFLFLNRLSTNKIMVFANKTKFKDELKYSLKYKAKQIYDYKKFKGISYS
jgi:hypothetical protein